MFIHSLKYSVKTLFKSKSLIFWIYAFPIILGTFFYLAFSDIEKSETFTSLDIAIVNNDNFKSNKVLKEAYKTLSDKNNKDKIFNIKYTNKKNAKKMLDDGIIVGYLHNGNIIVKKSDVSSSIFKMVNDEINSQSKVIEKIALKNYLYNIDYKKIIKDVQDEKVNIKDETSKKLSYTMIEFYTLIAMTCLYGGMLSIVAINNVLPNMSKKGMRVAVSNTKKSTLIISSLLSSYIVQIIGLIILFIYTIFVLKVDYGSELFKIIILSLAGSLAGLSIGTFVGSTFRCTENSKIGILLSITMLGCFLSGMMGITMKYIIDKNIPIVNKLNPANMITDGLYSLYYYTNFNRYYFNVASLLVFSSILIAISIFSLRRQKYDSI